MVRRIRLFVVVVLCGGLVVACSSLSYLGQSIGGHVNLLRKQRPIDTLVAKSDTPQELKQRLLVVNRIRRFAFDQLQLPDNGSYRSYVDVGRKYVVWNVVATPEFSLDPVDWCFPVVGCLNYLGFYSERNALRKANIMRGSGYDVVVSGVTAYSTLGWFADPVLNTMMRWDNFKLAEYIFHELAHQKLYVKNATAFDEAFATTVARTGVERWLEAQGTPTELERFIRLKVWQKRLIDRVFDTREQLESVYVSALTKQQMRREKARIFLEMWRDYWRLREQRPVTPTEKTWVSQDLNNAKIASVVTYYHLVAAFDALLRTVNNDLTAFYKYARRIGALPPRARTRCLTALAVQPSTSGHLRVCLHAFDTLEANAKSGSSEVRMASSSSLSGP